MIGRESHVDVSGLDFDQLCRICNANSNLRDFENFFQLKIVEITPFLEKTIPYS